MLKGGNAVGGTIPREKWHISKGMEAGKTGTFQLLDVFLLGIVVT